MHDNINQKAKKIRHQSLTLREAFEEINKKHTKIGALLKAVRLREGLSRKDFAALIKTKQGDLSKMEMGKLPVGETLAARITKKFKSKIT